MKVMLLELFFKSLLIVMVAQTVAGMILWDMVFVFLPNM